MLTCKTLNENIGRPIFSKLDWRKADRLTKKFQALTIEKPPNAGIWDLLPNSLGISKAAARIRKHDVATRTAGEGVYEKLLWNGECATEVTFAIAWVNCSLELCNL